MEQCQLLVGTGKPRIARGESSDVAGDAVTGPLLPDDLRAAYGLARAAKAGGTGETVAVVEAFRDPHAVPDFDRYRQLNKLPACVPATGAGCLTVLNEDGRGWPLPVGTAAGWEDESALDVEMVAAICPNCRVALFEANSASLTDLGTAGNSAARVARFISDSWTGSDFPGESQFDALYFNHPGVAITVASGDAGYDAGYPASSQLVTSVGGTYLNAAGAYLNAARAGRRGWTEVAWSGQSTGPGTGTQSGCSSGEPKPAWQSDPGCANRTETDVAAVADAPAGVEFYSSSRDCGGVCEGYGTSVATPIIAAVYALAGPPRAGTYPAEYPYLNRAGLYRVTSGADGTCEANRRYLCNDAYSLGDGYNGPDGLGTPDGTAAFAAPSAGNIVSVINPGTYDLQAGLDYRLPPIRAYDSAAGEPLAFSATGLPAGLSISPSRGVISGTLPAARPTDAVVRVTVADPSGARGTVSFRIVGVRSLTGAYRGGQGEVSLDAGRLCLDDRGRRARTGTPVQVWRCLNDLAQRWTFRPGGVPGGAGALVTGGRCLDVTGRARQAKARVAIWPCTGYGNQQWLITGAGELYNPASGMCLDDPGGSRVNGQQVGIKPCQGTRQQAWALPASPITSGVTGRCLDDFGGNHANGARVVIFRCDGTHDQAFRLGLDGTIRIGGKCVDVTGGSADDGTPVRLHQCDGAPGEIFQAGSFGMLQNLGSGKCLADPGNAVADGTQLVIEDCYGLPGEIWALS
jgi:Ricin-type beta-trefoil lectin domain/Putative Ig domain